MMEYNTTCRLYKRAVFFSASVSLLGLNGVGREWVMLFQGFYQHFFRHIMSVAKERSSPLLSFPGSLPFYLESHVLFLRTKSWLMALSSRDLLHLQSISAPDYEAGASVAQFLLLSIATHALVGSALYPNPIVVS
jgi:hypothetical protein